MHRASPVPLTAVGPVPEDQLAELREAVSSHHGLKAVLDWCLGQEPPILGTSAVTQDEFTRDLIVPLPSGLFLVYDST